MKICSSYFWLNKTLISPTCIWHLKPRQPVTLSCAFLRREAQTHASCIFCRCIGHQRVWLKHSFKCRSWLKSELFQKCQKSGLGISKPADFLSAHALEFPECPEVLSTLSAYVSFLFMTNMANSHIGLGRGEWAIDESESELRVGDRLGGLRSRFISMGWKNRWLSDELNWEKVSWNTLSGCSLILNGIWIVQRIHYLCFKIWRSNLVAMAIVLFGQKPLTLYVMFFTVKFLMV